MNKTIVLLARSFGLLLIFFLFSDPAFATSPMISAGGLHSLALNSDGTVWGWGNNQYGQIGDGTREARHTPVQVSSLSEVTAIAAGEVHSMALKSDGTVWVWGANTLGQIGDGTRETRPAPVQVGSLSGITAIAAGWNHSLALKNDGTVWAWGYNLAGQIGDGSMTRIIATPVQVGSLSGITAIAAGDDHSLALKSDGSVWSWGGKYGKKTTPVKVKSLSGVIAIAAGGSHLKIKTDYFTAWGMALKSDGTVWAWGANWDGQLGDGTMKRKTAPVQVSKLSGVIAITAGGLHSMALKNDDTVWAWGGQ